MWVRRVHHGLTGHHMWAGLITFQPLSIRIRALTSARKQENVARIPDDTSNPQTLNHVTVSGQFHSSLLRQNPGENWCWTEKKQSESWVEWRAGRGCGLVVVSPYCSNVCVTVTLLGTAGCRAGKYGWAEGGGGRRNGRAACFSSNICREAAFTFSSVWCQTSADVSFYVDYMKSNFAVVIISFYISFFFFSFFPYNASTVIYTHPPLF